MAWRGLHRPDQAEIVPPALQIFYRMAKRSATECAAILDVCPRIDVVAPPSHKQARGLLLRIVSMLTKLAK